MYSTTKDITAKFIKDGWSKNISFEELLLNEAKKKGYQFIINRMNNGEKFFKMLFCENIYDSNGKLVSFNILPR